MSASKIPNQNGKYERKFKLPDGTFLPDGRSHQQALPIPHDTPVFFRTTPAAAFRLDKMVRDLGFRGRVQLVEHGLDLVALLETKVTELGAHDRNELLVEALAVMTQLEAVAARLNYRDRRDLLADLVSSLLFLMKQAPIPSFARIEDTQRLAPPATPDQPNLL